MATNENKSITKGKINLVLRRFLVIYILCTGNIVYVCNTANRGVIFSSTQYMYNVPNINSSCVCVNCSTDELLCFVRLRWPTELCMFSFRDVNNCRSSRSQKLWNTRHRKFRLVSAQVG